MYFKSFIKLKCLKLEKFLKKIFLFILCDNFLKKYKKHRKKSLRNRKKLKFI